MTDTIDTSPEAVELFDFPYDGVLRCDGDYVRFTDYQKLAAEVAKLREALETIAYDTGIGLQSNVIAYESFARAALAEGDKADGQ